ncbi:hypothetical protein LN050_07205 [Comamonadaceae bacterium M7527]|nr:hypothetical protein LN050_07205 [Comamonadaceae bacterium M7527]
MTFKQAGKPLKPSKRLSSKLGRYTCRKAALKLASGVTKSRLDDLESLKRKALSKTKPSHALRDKLDKLKASSRAKLEHTLQAIKSQLGHRKTRYRSLVKKVWSNAPQQAQRGLERWQGI